MSPAAYEINGQQVAPEQFYQVACDPHRSVVVEACAGAGKTWMLVSRILRALLDGVPPNQILAITFTKKAAGEMRERLHHWLRDFAKGSDADRERELLIRGVPRDRLAELAPRLQSLYAQWLEDGKGVDIGVFVNSDSKQYPTTDVRVAFNASSNDTLDGVSVRTYNTGAIDRLAVFSNSLVNNSRYGLRVLQDVPGGITRFTQEQNTFSGNALGSISSNL